MILLHEIMLLRTFFLRYKMNAAHIILMIISTRVLKPYYMCLRVSDVTVCLAINQSPPPGEIRNHAGAVRGGFCRLCNLGNIQWLGLLSMLSQMLFVDRGIQSASMQASYQSLSTQQKRHTASSNGSAFTDIKHSYEKWQNFISSLRMTPHQCVLSASQQVYMKRSGALLQPICCMTAIHSSG